MEVAENNCLQVPQGAVVVKLARPKICEQLLLDQSFGSRLQPLGSLRVQGVCLGFEGHVLEITIIKFGWKSRTLELQQLTGSELDDRGKIN